MKILIFKGTSRLDRAIRFFTGGGPYCHVAVMTEEGSRTIIEAVLKIGVRQRMIGDSELGDFDVFSVAGLTNEGEMEALAWLRQQIGKPYFTGDLVNFVTHRPVKDNQDQKFICSMLGFETVFRGGVKLLDRVADWGVSPNLLAVSPLLIQEPALKQKFPVK